MDQEKALLLDSSTVSDGSSSSADRKYDSIALNSPREHHFQTYKRRWWIIFAFALCSAAQSAHWNTWNPIMDAVKIGYNWDDSFVALFPAISNVGYVLFGLPVMYLVETQGLRFGTVMGACLIMSTMVFWNIALGLQQNWLIIIGSLFNGVAATITMAVPPLLSAIWFPVSERTTATAIAAASGYTGTSLSFITGPYISGANVNAADVKNSSNLPESFKEKLRVGVQDVLYFDTAFAVLCFTCVLIYYPAKPPKPPTKTADVEREDFWHGVKDLFRNPSFLVLNLAYNIPNGTFNGWLPLVSVNFRPLGISEDVAAWIGFTALLSACISSVIVSFFVDYFKHIMKKIMLVMSAVSILCLTMILCVQENYIHIPPENITTVLYVLCIAISISINGTIPLYYEMGCEMAYPVHEGLVCSFITVVNNIFGSLYFFLLLLPGLGTDTQWMTWLALATVVITFPMLLLLKERFNRLDVDEKDPSTKE